MLRLNDSMNIPSFREVSTRGKMYVTMNIFLKDYNCPLKSRHRWDNIFISIVVPLYPWGIGFRTPTEYQNSKMLKSLVCKTVFYLHIIFYIFSCVLYIISRLLMIPNTMKSMANSSFVLEASGIFFFYPLSVESKDEELKATESQLYSFSIPEKIASFF